MHLADLTWPAVAALDRDLPVIIPVAALEQHGHHMPVFTDSMLLGEVVRRTSEKVGDQALFAPLTWLGNSDHHMDFPGTLSATPRLYLDLLNNLLENFLTHGFRRLLLVNGHGGNIVPGHQAIFETRQRNRARRDLLLLFASYWDLGGIPKDSDPKIHQTRVGHACEIETAMMLRIAPHLVQGDVTKLSSVSWGSAFEPGYRGWITKDRSEIGHIGDPQYATADKGELLFEQFANGTAAYIGRMNAWDGKSWDG